MASTGLPPISRHWSDSTMNSPLKILVIEDSLADYLLLERHLHQQGLASKCLRIDSNAELESALQEDWDIVLSDYKVPGMDLPASLQTINARNPNLPVILVSGTIGEEVAVDLLHHGLTDFILKDRLARLPNAIRRALDEVRVRQARKDAETALLESEEKYRQLFESSRDALMLVMLPSLKFSKANQATLKLFGASNENEFTTLVPSDISPERQPDGSFTHEKSREMIEIALREGSHMFEWEHQRLDGHPFVADVLLTRMDLGGNVYLQATVRDISERKRSEQRISAYVKQLENSMHGTLQAVANMVEFRDPYTAGHERRVGIIASDIGRELGLSEEKCKNLQFIGLVHDIGKISIPSEILSKPGRLTALEFEMVKVHAEKGYEILKDVEFHLPIAKIIRQHHERMDGSGYPLGLKGQDILPEARIIAVADVLESMASHRPYRPALGIEVALKEIIDHRGSQFDAEVVDAVLKLIHDKGYKLPS